MPVLYMYLDNSCNKYSNLIGYWQVSMCDSRLEASHGHLQDFHGHLQVLPSGSSNTKLYDLNLLDTV